MHGESNPPSSSSMLSRQDWELVRRLQAGDESAFQQVLLLYHNSMVRIATIYVANRETAKEVVQETWLAVYSGLARFQGRSSLKTWIFSILLNRARTKHLRESRTIPFSAVSDPDIAPAEPAVDPDRFLPDDHRWAHHWVSFPRNWNEIPEEQVLSQELVGYIRQTIEKLEPSQREVITLRDIEGWTSDEICNVLQITETNQRVLLHRARSKVRRALERYLDGPESNERDK